MDYDVIAGRYIGGYVIRHRPRDRLGVLICGPVAPKRRTIAKDAGRFRGARCDWAGPLFEGVLMPTPRRQTDRLGA